MTIKVQLVDDRVIFREGLKALIGGMADMEVVAEAASGVEALRQAVLCRPDVVVVEPVLPDMSGLDVTRCLHAELPGVKVLVLAAVSDETQSRSALEAGAQRYLGKECGFAELAGTIRAAATGAASVEECPEASAPGVACCGGAAAFRSRLRDVVTESARAEAEERQKVASALHDQIGQSLALAKIGLDALQKHHPFTPEDPPSRELRHIRELLDHAIDETRSLTVELASPVLEERPMGQALTALCADFQERHGIEIGLRQELREERLPHELRALLYQSVRELLVNVVKHARATHAEVSVCRGDGTLSVRVQDDGIGFDRRMRKRGTLSRAGFGLFRMRRRVKSCGGEVEIFSAPGEGTAVTLTLPIHPSSQPSR